MKVNDVHGDLAISNNSTEPLQSERAEHQKEVAPAEVQVKEEVSISPTSIEISKAVEVMERESPERSEKIQAIQKALRKGTYEVDPAKVARKMILDILSE
jgi:flagellar biosynthesis anti-sigma factor FlgM